MPRTVHRPLTDRQVRAVAPRQTPIDVRDGHTRGLILTVLPSGRRQFGIRYRYRGKQRRFVLGDYPELTLTQARRRARKQQVAIADGGDPAGERRATKEARTDTVAALAADYLTKHARKFKKSAYEDERMLRVNVLPVWGDRSVRDLTRRDVRALIEDIAERAPIMANRTLALVSKMLNFAIDHDWIDANPAARVDKPSPEVSRDRVLDDDEIRRVWRLLSTTTNGDDEDHPPWPASPAFAAVIKLRLLTAQRGGEVARMRWSDVDVETGWWTIPGSDTKNGQPHRVPLVARALTIITEQPHTASASVFVGGGRTWLDRAKKAPSIIARTLGIDFRGHDLRRTAATRMAAAGILREHISRVLNHVEAGPRATRVYDRYSYDREKREALEIWARALDAILTGKPKGADIVPIRRG